MGISRLAKQRLDGFIAVTVSLIHFTTLDIFGVFDRRCACVYSSVWPLIIKCILRNVRPGLCVTHGVLVYSRDFRFRSSKDGIGGIIAYFHVWHVLAVDTQCYDMTD